MNNGLKFGLYYGIFASVITTIQYFLFPASITSPITMVFNMIYPLVFMWMASKAERSDQDGIISFGEALIPAFLTFVIGGLITALIGFALLKLVPGLLETQAELAGEATESMIATMSEYLPDGAEKPDLAQAKAEAIDATMNMGIGTHLAGWLMSAVFGLIPSMIIAAIIKRNPSA